MSQPLIGRAWWWAVGLVLVLALLALSPTTGDFGLTYDEPAYRYSQMLSIQWWEQLGQSRSRSDLEALLDPEALLYYWPYGRHGINFHPPLAGQLNLLTYSLFGGFLKDIPARRMASVIEFALTVAILFGFLARRYGSWVGLVASGSLLLMPRLYGQGHLMDTDIPGLFLWAAAALAFWKGIHEPNAQRWRVLVGVLAGLAFVEKMGTVVVLLPILVWSLAARFGRFRRGGLDRGDWVDGILTTGLMLAPLGLAYLEIRRLAEAFFLIQRRMGVADSQVSPARTDLFRDHPESYLPAAILLVPMAVWLVRRGLGRIFRRSPIWGRERPVLETWHAILAFAPMIAWFGNPAWWRETLPRLAHYYSLNSARRGSLPDIRILYFGQTYDYSLPWHNAWVLLAITVPVGILLASLVGIVWAVARSRKDRLPLYFLLHFATLPAFRMLETPAHDGVRLFLPSFFFLAAFAGWGTIWVADGLSRLIQQGQRADWFRGLLAAAVLGSSAWSLVRIHPYELSYYNAIIGGPRGAWESGFELTYWYDAFTPAVIEKLNEKLPPDAHVSFPNALSAPTTFQDLQALGQLRGDIRLDAPDDRFPYLWLLTHDSKAMAQTRLLFAMQPWFTDEPKQLDGLRVLTVASPEAASRSIALQLLTDAPAPDMPEPLLAPDWIHRFLPPLARFWGDGLTKAKPLHVNEPIFDWARDDPEGLRRAAQAIVKHARERPETISRPNSLNPEAFRLTQVLFRYPSSATVLLQKRPEALSEAIEILIQRPNAVRAVLTRYSFTDTSQIGGYLDQGIALTD